MTRIAGFTMAAVLVATALLHGQTAPARQGGSTAPTGRYTAIGCLTRQGTAAAPRYVVTDPRGTKPTVYRLEGDAALLAVHVGHTVEVTGPMRPNGMLRVNSLVWIASSCKG